MEKHEKIQKSKRRQIFFSVAAVASLLFAGTFLTNKNDTLALSAPVIRGPSEQELLKNVQELDKKVRKIKEKCNPPNCFMEVDAQALKATKKLRDATRLLLDKRYGTTGPIRVVVELEFQPTISDYEAMGPNGSFVVEMAPTTLLPHSVYMFLEIARKWKGGAFNRNAGHVLQARTKNPPFKRLAFQEYSKKFPHEERTLGYAGRPSSSDWYISIANNTENHGPGSQQKANPHEADSLFGRIVDGYDDTIERIKKMEGTSGENAFVKDEKYHVLITSMHIMVPGPGPDGYVFWKPT